MTPRNLETISLMPLNSPWRFLNFSSCSSYNDLTFSISLLALLTKLAIINLYCKKLLSINWCSYDHCPNESNFLYIASLKSLSFLLKSSPTALGYESSYEKKISFISSSSSKFNDGFACLIFFSSTISFSTNKDNVNSILIDLWSWVGSWTSFSFSTIFSTITSFGI